MCRVNTTFQLKLGPSPNFCAIRRKLLSEQPTKIMRSVPFFPQVRTQFFCREIELN